MQRCGVGLIKGVLSQNVCGGSEENHNCLRQDSRPPGSDFKPVPHEYETGLITADRRTAIMINLRATAVVWSPRPPALKSFDPPPIFRTHNTIVDTEFLSTFTRISQKLFVGYQDIKCQDTQKYLSLHNA
jgi:hypothetical protein